MMVHTTITPEELDVLTHVVKEHLTDLRSEMLEADAGSAAQALQQKDEVLRVVLAKLERERHAVQQFLNV